jgi:hypothetical protein
MRDFRRCASTAAPIAKADGFPKHKDFDGFTARRRNGYRT